jgi:hypothetical protein
MAALPACRSTSIEIPTGKEVSLLQRGFLLMFSHRKMLTELV